MNRRRFTFSISAFLLAMIWPAALKAETLLEVGDYFGAGTDTVSVELALHNPDAAVAGLQFDLLWDRQDFSYLGMESAERTKGWLLEGRSYGTNGVRVVAYDLSGTRIAEGSGTILRLYFLPTGDKSFSSVGLTLDRVHLANDDGEPIDVRTRGGQVVLWSDQQSLHISDGGAQPGAQDTLAIVLDHLDPVSAFEFWIQDEPNLLKGVDVLPGEGFSGVDLSGWQISGSEDGEGNYTILGFTTVWQYLAAGSDTLCHVIYAVDSDAAFTDVNLELANVAVLDTLGNTLELESGSANFRVGAPPVWIDVPRDTLEFGTPIVLELQIENREALRYFQIDLEDTATIFDLDSTRFSVADWELLVFEPEAGNFQFIGYSPNQQLIPANTQSVLTLYMSPPDSGRESWYTLALEESVFRDSLDRPLAVNIAAVKLALMNPLQRPLWLTPPPGQTLDLNYDWLCGEELLFSWRPAGTSDFLPIAYLLQMQVDSQEYSFLRAVVNDTAVTIDLAGLLQDFQDQGLVYPAEFDLICSLTARKGGRESAAGDSIRIHFMIGTAVDPTDNGIADDFRLDPIAPNPFNSTATVRFALPREEMAEIVVLDLRGNRVAILLHERLPAGEHRLHWRGLDQNGMQAQSGLYFCVFRAGDSRLVRKMILLR